MSAKKKKKKKAKKKKAKKKAGGGNGKKTIGEMNDQEIGRYLRATNETDRALGRAIALLEGKLAMGPPADEQIYIIEKKGDLAEV